MLICIGLALVFWILTKLSKTYTYDKEVALRFSVPEGRSFIEQPPSTLTAKLEGRGWELMFDYVVGPEIILSYNLEYQDLLSLSQDQLRSDVRRKLAFGNIKVAELNAGNINLSLEEKATKRVPIKVRDSLVFSSGYHLRAIKIKPDSVTLTGSISLLDSISQWKTDSFFISDIKNNLNRTVSLAKPSGALQLNVKSAAVDIQVEQITEKSMFIPLTVRNAPDSLKYFPESVKVTCVVGLSDYNKIKNEDFSAEIDLANVSLSEGKNTIPIRMVKQSPQAITVQFTPKSAEFFLFKK